MPWTIKETKETLNHDRFNAEIWTRKLPNEQQKCYPLDRHVWPKYPYDKNWIILRISDKWNECILYYRTDFNDFRTPSFQIAEFSPTSLAMPPSMLGKLVLLCYLHSHLRNSRLWTPVPAIATAICSTVVSPGVRPEHRNVPAQEIQWTVIFKIINILKRSEGVNERLWLIEKMFN